MAVQIVIDSCSDFYRPEAEEKGLTFLPLTVQWEGRTYRDQVDLPPREFYEKLIECSDLPTTGQLTPYDFTEAFRRLTENGDEVVAITLSSKLSGTFQSGMIAAGDFPGKVFVVDSLNATFGEHVLVRYALRLRDAGMGAEEMARELDRAKTRIRLIALVDTLEYLKRGGRISAVTAAAGGLLSIKPVISVVDGEVKVIGKARGSKKANNLLTELITQSGGVNFDMPCALGFSGLDDSMLRKYVEDSAALWQGRADRLPVCAIGAVIGAHVGPGAVGAAFFAKE